MGDAREGVGYVDEAALLVDFVNRLLEREPSAERSAEEHPHNLAVEGIDLLGDDGPRERPTGVMPFHKTAERVACDDFGGGERTGKGVMVRDGEGAEAAADARRDDGPRRDAGIVGARGMNMEVCFNHRRTRSGPDRRRYRRGRWWLLFAPAAAALAFVACGERAEGYFNEARKLERNYEYEEAARRYELVAVGFKRSALAAAAAEGLTRSRAEIHLDRAEELIYRGASYTALQELAAARRLAPGRPRALYLAGLAHLHIGPRSCALAEFNECVRRYPESPYGYLGRGEFFRTGLAREKAFADYVRAFRVARDDARSRGAAFRGIRDMAEKLELPQEELVSYRREGLAANHAAFDYWTGYYYMARKPVNYGLAANFFGTVLTAKNAGSYRARAHAGLATCYFGQKDFARAKTHIDQALAADPDNDAFYKLAGDIYRELSLPPPRKTQK